MDETPNLGLPYIMAAQSQKHVTHNEAIRALDAVVQLSVLDRDLTAPPGSPAEGARYIVAASPSGAWTGHAGSIAAFQDAAWMFYPPNEGWIAWIADEDVAVVWSGSAWTALTTGGGGGSGSFTTLGINATADTTNRLSLAADATLLNHDGDGHQLKINKAAAGDTASLLYQDAFSGRAELGLAGDDDFHFKVSPDGSTWKEAMLINRSTGAVTFPFTSLSGGREMLTANRTYYVRTAPAAVTSITNASPAVVNATGHGLSVGDPVVFSTTGTLPTGLAAGTVYYVISAGFGANAFEVSATPGGSAIDTSSAGSGTHSIQTGNNDNDGLAQTRTGAFLTIQAAINAVGAIDLSIYNVVIQCAAGVYTSGNTLVSLTGAGQVTIRGDTTTPSNCFHATTSATAFSGTNVAGKWKVEGFRFTTTTSGRPINVTGVVTNLTLGANDYGACADTHIMVQEGAYVAFSASYTISGGAPRHIEANIGAIVTILSALTCTLTGTPAFANQFILAANLSYIRASGITYSGSATGTRYSATGNAVINTAGGGASFLPGSATGSTATGGQYL